MNKQAYMKGYLQKEALSSEQVGQAVAASLGLGSGLLGNFMLSRMLGYRGNFMNYLIAGGAGAAGGELVSRRIAAFAENPQALAAMLEKVENSPQLAAWHKWQKDSPAMVKPRQMFGRVMTNIKSPVGYDATEIGRNLLKYKNNPAEAFRRLKDDQPLWDFKKLPTAPEAAERKRTYNASREALNRAYYDLPPRAGTDLFRQQNGKDWTFNRSDKGGEFLYNELKKEVERKNKQGYGTHSTLGGFSIKRGPAGEAIVEDPFDYHTSAKRQLGETGGYSSIGDLHTEGDVSRERVVHHARNIMDRLIGNPATVKARFPNVRK
jgi:hypothetical protein